MWNTAIDSTFTDWFQLIMWTWLLSHVPSQSGPWTPFNPLALRVAKTGLTILLIFSSQKYQKYLKEKCLSEYYQQLSFKYFVRICFISKLFSKVWKEQTILSWGTLSVNGLIRVEIVHSQVSYRNKQSCKHSRALFNSYTWQKPMGMSIDFPADHCTAQISRLWLNCDVQSVCAIY